jgi:hypothetical protein
MQITSYFIYMKKSVCNKDKNHEQLIQIRRRIDEKAIKMRAILF